MCIYVCERMYAVLFMNKYIPNNFFKKLIFF